MVIGFQILVIHVLYQPCIALITAALLLVSARGSMAVILGRRLGGDVSLVTPRCAASASAAPSSYAAATEPATAARAAARAVGHARPARAGPARAPSTPPAVPPSPPCHLALNVETDWHVFVSNVWSSGQDQARAVKQLRREVLLGVRVGARALTRLSRGIRAERTGIWRPGRLFKRAHALPEAQGRGC